MSFPQDGEFKILAKGGFGQYLSHIYPAEFCVPFTTQFCPFEQGQTFLVRSAPDVTGIDFEMEPGGSISGHVVSGSGGPVAATIRLFDLDLNEIQSTVTDTNGRYRISVVPPRPYYVTARPTEGDAGLYRNFMCGSRCFEQDFANGEPVAIDLNQSRSGINFQLDTAPARARLSGTLRDGTTAQTIGGCISLDQIDGQNRPSTCVNAAGAYRLDMGVEGTYTIKVQGEGYATRLYERIDCETPACQGALGAQVPLFGFDNTLDFDLTPLASAKGVVRNGATNLPVAEATVSAYQPTANGAGLSGRVTTDSEGRWVIALQPGEHYFVAGATGFITELSSDIPCEGTLTNPICPASGIDPTTVDHGQRYEDIDFSLAPLGGIAGRVFPRFLLSGAQLNGIIKATNVETGIDYRSNPRADGNFEISDLPDGLYNISYGGSTFVDGGTFRAVYPGTDCDYAAGPTCESVARSIAVTDGVQSELVEFTVLSRSTINGSVTDDATGSAIPGVVVDIWDSELSNVLVSGTTDNEGKYAMKVPDLEREPRTLELSTDNNLGYRNQVFDRLSCDEGSAFDGRCSRASAAQIRIPLEVPATGIVDFALENVDAIFASGFE